MTGFWPVKNKTNLTQKGAPGETKFLKCEIWSEKRSDVLFLITGCLEMLDRVLSTVFEGLTNCRPACQDKVPLLAEHTGADQIPIRMSLVSIA